VPPSPQTIAHVNTESGFSGGEVQVFLLMEGLRARGHRNLLACQPGGQAEERARAAGFQVAPVAMRNDLDLGAIRKLRRVFEQSGTELVHLHTGRANWLGGWGARRASLPAVSTRRMDRRVKRGLRTRLIYGKLVQRVAAISPAVRDCLLAGGVPEEQIELIPSSIDPARLEPQRARADVRRELGAADADVVVLTACALVERKGIDVLLDAFAHDATRGARLWIVGDGAERTALEARACSLDIAERVQFLGRRDDVPDLLHAADLFVLPSRAEGLGVAALEAMTAGRAVVASRVGGLAFAVEHEVTGLLVEPEDVAGLRRALARSIADADLRASYARAGRQRIEAHFLAEQMVSSYEALYARVLAETSGKR